MNDLKIFENEQFGSVRTIEKDNKIYFCGSDVAKALGYSNPRDAIARHCKADGVVKHDVVSETVNQHGVATQQNVTMNFITEGNVYRLITHSKLPAAEQFEHWVFDEVLPSIRKHGAYMTANTLEQALLSPDYLIRLATALKHEKEQRKLLEEKNEQQRSKIEEDKPKVIFAEAVETAKTSILVGELAKILKQNGVATGQKRFFEWLRTNGYLIKSGSDKNMPTQRSMELGLFEIKETAIAHSDGHTTVQKTPKVTGKGQQYFINKFLPKNESKIENAE